MAEHPKVCVLCGAPNGDPRPWDPREPTCPDCQDGRGPRTTPETPHD